MILRIQRLVLVQELLDSCKVAVLGSLMQRERRVLDLLQNWLKLGWETAHLLADLQPLLNSTPNTNSKLYS